MSTSDDATGGASGTPAAPSAAGSDGGVGFSAACSAALRASSAALSAAALRSLTLLSFSSAILFFSAPAHNPCHGAHTCLHLQHPNPRAA